MPGSVTLDQGARTAVKRLKKNFPQCSGHNLEQLIFRIQRESRWRDHNDPHGEKRFQEAQRRLNSETWLPDWRSQRSQKSNVKENRFVVLHPLQPSAQLHLRTFLSSSIHCYIPGKYFTNLWPTPEIKHYLVFISIQIGQNQRICQLSVIDLIKSDAETAIMFEKKAGPEVSTPNSCCRRRHA